MHTTPRPLRRMLRDRRGVSALEYTILVGVIAAALTAGLGVFGGSITTAFTTIAANVTKTVAGVGN